MGKTKTTSPARGQAGRRGDDVRSDLWVGVGAAAGGGIAIELASRVASYYGDAIREQISTLVRAAGIEHARIEVQDGGALPFVIAARVETALRHAGLVGEADLRPAVMAPAREPSARLRIRRSRLYLPGDEPKYFINAGLHRPDGIILDLEDSVHPDAKDGARALVRNALRCVDFGAVERMVRINQLPLGLDDLAAVAPERPDLILIPKVETADQVREADALLERIGANAAGGPWLMPILESALGIEQAFEIARSCDRVAALTLGLEDYAADLGVPKSADGDESLYARTRVVNAARAAGVQPIDSVYGQVDDLEGLGRWGERSRRLGFVGMGCLHPRQIRPIHDAYDPTAAEIEHARRIVAAFEKARAAGRGVVSLGSKMIDPPVIEQSRRLVAQARAAGLLTDESD
jgi:citrate lyase subunit beta/citryl-CoA lyase